MTPKIVNTSAESLMKTCGPGSDPLQEKRAEDHGGRAAARNAQRQEGNHRRCHRRGGRGLGRAILFGVFRSRAAPYACRTGLSVP